MKDFAPYKLGQTMDRASGTITFGVPVLARKATGTVTVVDYTQLAAAKAQGTVTFGVPVNGDTVTIDGHTFTKASTASGNNFAVIADLTTLINALTNVDATDNGTVITVVAAVAGSAGNALAMSLGTNTGTMAISGATLAGGHNNATITVNGTALVAGTDFTAATSNNATATSLATAIDGLALIGAAAVGAVITITADAYGTAANAYALVTSNVAGATVSGAHMDGGVAGDTVIVNSNTFTAVSGTPSAAQFKVIADLTALCEALANVTATDDGSTVTIVADAVGTGGNAYTLALGTNAGTMTISGATFTGGAAQTYTDSWQMAPEENAEVFINVTAIAGTSTPTLTATPQVSADNVNWVDAHDDSGNSLAFAGITSTGTVYKYLPHTGAYVRLKLVVTGTDASFTGTAKLIGVGGYRH